VLYAAQYTNAIEAIIYCFAAKVRATTTSTTTTLTRVYDVINIFSEIGALKSPTLRQKAKRFGGLCFGTLSSLKNQPVFEILENCIYSLISRIDC
jgi:hypothetical protein